MIKRGCAAFFRDAATGEWGVAAWVYILEQEGGGRTYVGWTTDPARRLACHNAGTGARFTRGRQWRLLHVEEHPDRSAAMRREAELKRKRALRAKIVAAARAGG